MRFKLRNRANRRRTKRVGVELARTLSVASQMALLFPSGIDVWAQRELAGGLERPPRPAAPKP